MKGLIVALSLLGIFLRTAWGLGSDCNMTIGDHGVLDSVNQTVNNCTWTITVPPNKFIKFYFSHMIMRNPTNSCSTNNLTMTELSATGESPLGVFCNMTIPKTIISYSTTRIRFSSNNSLSDPMNSHFAVDWSSFDVPNATKNFTQILSDNNGVLISPKYSSDNASHFNWTYRIVQEPGRIIQLAIHDLNITTDNTTCYNRLNIHDGDDDNSTLIASICDNKHYTIARLFNSTTNYMTVKLIVEKSLEKWQGLSAIFNTTDNRCGGLMKSPNGTIQNPGFGSGYEPNMTCKWRIQAPMDKVVKMKYSDFDVAWHETCGADYVQVNEVHVNGTSGLLGKHCGNKLPAAVVSNSSVVDVEFRSKEKGSYKGFKLDYSVVDKKAQ